MLLILHGLQHKTAGRFDAAQQFNDDVDGRVKQNIVGILCELFGVDRNIPFAVNIFFEYFCDLYGKSCVGLDLLPVHFKRFVCAGSDIPESEQSYINHFHK
ncbi:hypothetical protein SDC9_212574 [bioreactor metagenome]|uniref:Uncharacterized protein n=1 Tax=bioreactor metagenome TaxID=1076179 RepID=A0A645JN78_9ZZZZ